MTEQKRLIEMRARCPHCDSPEGYLVRKHNQDTVRCNLCDRFQHNAPRTETGEREVSVQTTHAAIKPKQRARILSRASGKCEVCGSRELLQVGHILSVEYGLEFGVEPALLNDDENLICECAQCNLGRGSEPMPLHLMVSILKARISFREKLERTA